MRNHNQPILKSSCLRRTNSKLMMQKNRHFSPHLIKHLSKVTPTKCKFFFSKCMMVLVTMLPRWIEGLLTNTSKHLAICPHPTFKSIYFKTNSYTKILQQSTETLRLRHWGLIQIFQEEVHPSQGIPFSDKWEGV